MSPGRRRLFWRFYLYGLLLLVLAVAATAVAGWLLGTRYPLRHNGRQIALRMARDLGPGPPDPARLQRRAEDLHQLARVDVAAYDAAGGRTAAAGEDAPGPLTAAERVSLKQNKPFHRGTRILVATPLEDGGYLLLAWSGADVLLRFAVSLLAILCVVALVVLRLTRTVTRPLQRIADAARALGQGDLSARSGLRRRDELGNLARVLDEMAERVERTVRGEKELWANISHEIRTPLARIRVALELAEEEGDAAALRGHLAGISGDLAELDRLLDDVLISARLDLGAGANGGMVVRAEPLSLAEVAGESARRFAERHPGRELSVQVGPELPPVPADRALLLRVLGNLLDNAAKYSEADSAIELVAARGAQVAMEVRDRGIGVSEEDLPRLFDQFFRTDRSRSRGTGGTGLGLTLCRRIVEAHGGTIAAARREGGGTVVRFTLPLARS